VAQTRELLEDDLGGFFQVGRSRLPLLLDLLQRAKQVPDSLLFHPFGFLEQSLNVGSPAGSNAVSGTPMKLSLSGDSRACAGVLADKRDEIVWRKGLSEEIALGVVAAETDQLGELRLVLHAFGDDMHVQ
jgi:hypothetical protein